MSDAASDGLREERRRAFAVKEYNELFDKEREKCVRLLTALLLYLEKPTFKNKAEAFQKLRNATHENAEVFLQKLKRKDKAVWASLLHFLLGFNNTFFTPFHKLSPFSHLVVTQGNFEGDSLEITLTKEMEKQGVFSLPRDDEWGKALVLLDSKPNIKAIIVDEELFPESTELQAKRKAARW